MSDVEELATELRRVVDRLSTMPLSRAEACSEDCHATAAFIVERTRELGAEVPADARVPHLAPQGLSALLAVVGGDYLDAARAHPGTDVSAVVDALTSLRRSLP